MKEYIERASLMGALTSGTEQLAMREMTGAEAYAEFVRLVNFVPVTNVVPVVRCRECTHYKICDEWKNGKRMLCEIHHHSYLDHDGDEHFCSWGQRREAEHDKHPSDPL